MNWEKAQKILEEAEFNSDAENEVFEGLKIISRHCGNITVTAEHDQIWAYLLNDGDIELFTEEDIKELAKNNWMADEEDGGFSKFV